MDYIYVILVILLFIILVFVRNHIIVLREKKRYEHLYKNLSQQMDNEQQKYKEQLFLIAYQNRLAQKGQIFNIVAHQWRQPLNTLSILLERCKQARSLSKLDDELFHDIHKQMGTMIQHMSTTIEDFSSFFKPDKKKKEFYIGDVLDKTLKLLKPTLVNANIQLIEDIDNSIKFVGYPNELGQAFINLINNAKDELISKDIEDKKISVELKKSNNTIQITICDNAGGISQDLMDKIFEPYFSTKNQKQGIGLGLYISRLVIQEHMDGDLYVENCEDGAKFIIEFKDSSI